MAALYREFNDHLGALLAAHPERFWGLAAIPAADPLAAAAELVRTRAFPGMIGVVVPVDAFLTPATSEAYQPLLAAAHRTRSHVYVHPGPTGRQDAGTGPIGFLRIDQGSDRWLMETGARLGAAALTLERSGVLDGFPGLSVHVSMLGGHLAWIAETLAFRSGAPDGAGVPSWPLRRIRVDTGILKPGGRAIAHAVAMFGADRILFGSDFPQFGTRSPAAAFAACGLEAGAQQSILHRNSDRLARELGLDP
jgi:predicted TIM-barrel fold metal-dependent hydrolase